MPRTAISLPAIIILLLCGNPVPAAAQPLGAFTWQLQPYCNRVTVEIVQSGSAYALDGFDDQCGAAQRVPVVGIATPNLDGTVAVGLNLVVATGVPVHLSASITLPAGSGIWRDSRGQTGPFMLGAATGGSPRPVPSTLLTDGSVTGASLALDAVTRAAIADGAVGMAEIDANAVQRRVSGVCAAGESIQIVNVDGTVLCQATTGTAAGDITSVAAGPGLAGGGTTGDVSLSVAFAGGGSAASAARSDHTHAIGGFANTSVGASALSTTVGSHNTAAGALALTATTTGGSNTATGSNALTANTAGTNNTATGAFALRANLGGQANTALGVSTLLSNTGGDDNTAVGISSLGANTVGASNTAVGSDALLASVSGSGNIAIGRSAGGTLVSGSNNIYLAANAATAAEASTMRLGSAVTRAFMGGVRGVTTGLNDALPVVVDSAGQLGTVAALPLADGSVTTLKLAADAVDGTKILAGAVAASDVNAAQVQLRVSGVCAAGSALRVVNQDGTVVCETAGGDISGVTAGAGLTGGGTSGTVALAVSYGGFGAATTAARSDHTHRLADNTNTAIGESALAANTSGFVNTAAGLSALAANTTGVRNTALGAGAALSNTTGYFNTAVGEIAMLFNVAGNFNTAIGQAALTSATNGHNNTALGHAALSHLTTGDNNVMVGANTGSGLTSGSNNIYVGAFSGNASESATMRLGLAQTATYIAGVSGQTAASGVAVFVDSAGRLGTLTSSARFKEGIEPIDAAASARVLALRPVRFVYAPAFDDGARTPQYGLVAEEVAETFPELVVRDAEGRPQTVRYQFLPPLLLAEVQRLERERDALTARVAVLERLARSLAVPR